MYTQCPDCGVAFRVTAEVLKMAAGKVRCGGCGVAFNALEHLSETKPVAPARQEQPPDPDLPQLTPEEAPELEADTPPETISAEQSAALLKTLDELAGEDIRIEDTGTEWQVIDDDKADAAPAEDAPEEPADEPSQVIDEMLFDDDTVLPDDFDAVVEAPSKPKPAETPPPVESEEIPQFDLDLSEPDEWDDLLGDLDEPDEEIKEPEDVEAEDDSLTAAPSADEPQLPDMDTQFALQAEALGIDVTGVHEAPDQQGLDEALEATHESEPGAESVDDSREEREADTDTSIEEDLIAAAFDTEAAERTQDEPEPEEEPEVEEDVEIDLQIEDEVETEDDVDDIALRFDDTVEQDIATLSMTLNEKIAEEEPGKDELDEEEQLADDVAVEDEFEIPEMSEEEKTINMMIDEELLAIAVEDEDGFASTIVQLQPDDKVEKEISDKDAAKKKTKDAKKKKKDKGKEKSKVKDHAPAAGVETIIMEGEFVRAELDKERLAADKAAAADDSGVTISINREKDDYERRREMSWAPPGAATYAGIVALVLLLVLQVIHHSREALATVPAFNAAVGPVYRMLGQPLTPTWNIAGWRFEATKGDTNEDGELLTIYSRVGNNADEPLPYPLVHLSLTDRFEDIIGSAVLEPAEYLPENADPRKLVPPGNTFNAVISIESPSPDATGFKLNVCYRLASGQLRCADHNFK